MQKLKDLTGHSFGSLIVLRSVGRRGQYNWMYWLCQCKCGVQKEIAHGSLVSGLVIGCGCGRGKHNTASRIAKRKKFVGKKFGKLTVQMFAGKVPDTNVTLWLCLCECGRTKIIRQATLSGHHAKSCGCLKTTPKVKDIEQLTKKVYDHIVNGTGPKNLQLEYGVWLGMKARCLNPNNPQYHNYGGRGITICPQWVHDYGQFKKDMGPRPDRYHSIDRIDNDGNYEPDNCRWVLPYQQIANSRPMLNAHYKDLVFQLD